MDIEVYCDESGMDALTRKDAQRYITIGGIWIFKTFVDSKD